MPPNERSGPEGTTPQARSQRLSHHDEAGPIIAPGADNAAAGAALRDEGAELVDAHTPEEWRALVDDMIAALVAAGRPFTADDVRERLRELPDPPRRTPGVGGCCRGRRPARSCGWASPAAGVVPRMPASSGSGGGRA